MQCDEVRPHRRLTIAAAAAPILADAVLRRKKSCRGSSCCPILLINIAVVLGPAVSAFYYSMTEWSGIGSGEIHRAGQLPHSSFSTIRRSGTPSGTMCSGWRCS